MSSISRDDKKNMLIRDIKKLESTRNLKPEFVKILKNKKKELEQITNEEDKEYLENLEKEEAVARQNREGAEEVVSSKVQEKQLTEENSDDAANAADMDKFKKASELNKERYESENVNINNTQTTASKRRTRRKKLNEDKAAKKIQTAFQTRKNKEKGKMGIENLKQMKEIEKTYDAKQLEAAELEAAKVGLKETCSSLNIEPKILEDALLALGINADFLNQPNNSEILLKSYTDKLTSCGTDKVKQSLGEDAYNNYRKNLREAYDIIDKIIKAANQEAKARAEIQARELKERQETEAQEAKARAEAEIKAKERQSIPPTCLSGETEPTELNSACNVLGLNPNFVNQADARKLLNSAYRKKMRICHTDKTALTDKMKEISQNINQAKVIIESELEKIEEAEARTKAEAEARTKAEAEARTKAEAETEANRQAFKTQFSSKQEILDKCGNYMKGFKGLTSLDVEKRAFEILEIKEEDFNIITNQQITRQILTTARDKAKQNLADCKKMNPVAYSNQNFKTALENIDGAHYILNAIIQTKEANSNVPNANSNVPNANSNVPNANGSVPNANGSVPNANGSVPNANSNVPNANSNVPNANSNVPNANSNVNPPFYTTKNIEDTIKAIKISKYLFNVSDKEYKKNLDIKYNDLYERAIGDAKETIKNAYKFLIIILNWDSKSIKNPTEQTIRNFFDNILPIKMRTFFLNYVDNALKYDTLSFEKTTIANKTRKNRQSSCLELGKSRRLILSRKAFPSQIKKLMDQKPYSIIQSKVQTREKEGKERESKAKETNEKEKEVRLKAEMQEQMTRLNELKITAQNYEEQNLQNQINKIEAEIANIGPDLFTDPINYDFLKGKLSEVNKLIKRIEESRK
jgi:hypothetical protein